MRRVMVFLPPKTSPAPTPTPTPTAPTPTPTAPTPTPTAPTPTPTAPTPTPTAPTPTPTAPTPTPTAPTPTPTAPTPTPTAPTPTPSASLDWTCVQTGSPGDYGACQQVSPGAGSYASEQACIDSGCGQPPPTPTPPLTPAVEFTSGYEVPQNSYYIVPLKSGNSVVVCVDYAPNMPNAKGPFSTYEDALKFMLTTKNSNNS